MKKIKNIILTLLIVFSLTFTINVHAQQSYTMSIDSPSTAAKGSNITLTFYANNISSIKGPTITEDIIRIILLTSTTSLLLLIFNIIILQNKEKLTPSNNNSNIFLLLLKCSLYFFISTNK